MPNLNRPERRRLQRRRISYYLPVMDSATGRILGRLADISPVGILVETEAILPSGLTFKLRMDFMEEIGGRACFELFAQTKWCRQDKILPYLYYAGFEIVDLPPDGIEVIRAIAQKYNKG